jgi:hypothetical protein
VFAGGDTWRLHVHDFIYGPIDTVILWLVLSHFFSDRCLAVRTLLVNPSRRPSKGCDFSFVCHFLSVLGGRG